MKKLQQQSIPIVQQDLSHEETIVQIAFSLEALEKIVSNIFSNVECSIERKKKRLHNIQNRCESAKQKVEKLSNINKSIKVFSCYKYPGPKLELFYKDPLRRLVETNEAFVRVKCTSLPPDKLSLKEKLKFYHVRDSTLPLKKPCETSSLEGLGVLPKNCSKVNSVLLYNTTQKVYEQYKIVDPFNNIDKTTDAAIRKGRDSVIESDPISIGTSELGYKNLHHYFYSPSIQDVPDIQAPINLPRLTGIAGDVKYSSDQHINAIEIDYEEAQINTNETVKYDGERTNQEVIEKENTATPTPQLPPPKPPPLPPPSFDIQDEPDQKRMTKAETSVSSDVRANLMEAIRQAGGKSKLKHVNHGKSEKNKPQSKGLMDDLHEKLHMRRKGISGKIDNTDGMLDRIVSMIPPPPAPLKQPENDDDEDWDD